MLDKVCAIGCLDLYTCFVNPRQTILGNTIIEFFSEVQYNHKKLIKLVVQQRTFYPGKFLSIVRLSPRAFNHNLFLLLALIRKVQHEEK